MSSDDLVNITRQRISGILAEHAEVKTALVVYDSGDELATVFLLSPYIKKEVDILSAIKLLSRLQNQLISGLDQTSSTKGKTDERGKES